MLLAGLPAEHAYHQLVTRNLPQQHAHVGREQARHLIAMM